MKITPKEHEELIKWSKDNYHTKVGLTGNIKFWWHPVVRLEMQRLHQEQLKAIKLIVAKRKKSK
jgi:predicted Rossmann-fold nucleotide-binding protein